MKRILLTLAIILVGLFNSNLYAQSYVPNDGEVIIFYPVSDLCKKELGGFDCFYNTSDVYKNEKTIVKPKYRFKQKSGLTPFEEIEGHSFTVIKSTIENNDARKLDKKKFLVFLKRDDGENVLLRIPYIYEQGDNILTNSMSLNKYDMLGKYYINIPCCLEKELSLLKSKYIDNDVMFYCNSDRKNTNNLFIANTKEIQKNFKINFFKEKHLVYHCENVLFRDIDNHTYKQPVVLLNYKNNKFLVPAFDFRGSGSTFYGINYSFNDFFENKNILFEKKYRAVNDNIKDLVGKYIVYNVWKDVERNIYERTYNVANNERYKFQKHERYYVEKIDFSQINDINDICYDYYLFAILKDDLNNKIQMPVRCLKKDDYGYYGGLFELEDSILARKKKQELETAKSDSIDNMYYNQIKKKYGNSYAAYYKELYDFQKETFRKAAVKWGPSVAKDICEGRVRLGWNKEKCLMSWGEPKDINRSIGSWGVHEQWCYSSSYLYFENGKLTSIQN